jgi:hypothetical protein
MGSLGEHYVEPVILFGRRVINSSSKQCLLIVYKFWGIQSSLHSIYRKRFPTKRRVLMPLEIFLAPYKAKSGLRVHVTLDVQLTAQNLRTTEEDAHFA